MVGQFDCELQLAHVAVLPRCAIAAVVPRCMADLVVELGDEEEALLAIRPGVIRADGLIRGKGVAKASITILMCAVAAVVLHCMADFVVELGDGEDVLLAI